MIRAYLANVTTTGGAGASSGAVDVGVAPGKLVGVFLDWQINQGVPTADVTITNQGRTLLATTNSTTDAYVPVVENSVQGSNNTAAPAGDNRWEKPVVNGPIHVAVAQSDDGAPALKVILYVEH